jgi:hypothetical protein
MEDTQTSVIHLKNAGIPWRVIDAVELLTRDDGQPYEDYLHWIAKDEIARKVKIADIRHNLSDAPTDKQIAKYGKALLILANDIGHPRRGEKPEIKMRRYPPLDEPACSPWGSLLCSHASYCCLSASMIWSRSNGGSLFIRNIFHSWDIQRKLSYLDNHNKHSQSL